MIQPSLPPRRSASNRRTLAKALFCRAALGAAAAACLLVSSCQTTQQTPAKPNSYRLSTLADGIDEINDMQLLPGKEQEFIDKLLQIMKAERAAYLSYLQKHSLADLEPAPPAPYVFEWSYIRPSVTSDESASDCVIFVVDGLNIGGRFCSPSEAARMQDYFTPETVDKVRRSTEEFWRLNPSVAPKQPKP